MGKCQQIVIVGEYMARHTLVYIINEDNRDRGKTFLITEMPARKAESWAMRAIIALMANNADLPEGFEHAGMAGMAEVGMRALTGLKWDVVEPLMEEMMQCVEYIPDPSKMYRKRKIIDEDIEEIMTRINLRAEVWKLHTDFLKAVAPQFLGKQAAAQEIAESTPSI
jgi:hypothetical protein